MAGLNPFRRHMLVLRLDAGGLLEAFLVAAVTSFLVVRFILAVTEYPTLGGTHLHIAHMLWGGLGMMAAVVMLLVSVSRLSAEIAAVLGGAGFGVFIDELGKVISRDNNYFYRPTVAVIYVIFVVLVLVFRRLAARARRSPWPTSPAPWSSPRRPSSATSTPKRSSAPWRCWGAATRATRW